MSDHDDLRERLTRLRENLEISATSPAADTLTEAAEAVAERDRLREALERLRNGPDTLTQAGLQIVNDALLDQEGGK